jgi:hypothetical protein
VAGQRIGYVRVSTLDQNDGGPAVSAAVAMDSLASYRRRGRLVLHSGTGGASTTHPFPWAQFRLPTTGNNRSSAPASTAFSIR